MENEVKISICKVCRKSSDKHQKIKWKTDSLCLDCHNKTQIKPKFLFDVKVETMLPATITYRIMAETPEQAAELIRNQSPNSVKYKLIGRRDIKLAVYQAGCSIIKLLKRLAG